MKKPKDSPPPVATNPEEIEELIVRIEKDELSAQDCVFRQPVNTDSDASGLGQIW